jgi:hypothetical protein
MSRDVCAKTKCAPKIYRKFSNQQRLVWNHLYREFNEVSNFPPLAKNEKYSQEHIEVTAHNMACQAAWELARLNIIEGRTRSTKFALRVVRSFVLASVMSAVVGAVRHHGQRANFVRVRENVGCNFALKFTYRSLVCKI